MAAQKRPSQRHGAKYLASASTLDHARHAFLPRHRDTGILDSLGRFFAGDKGVPKRGSGKVPWLKQGRSPLPAHAHSRPGLCNMYKDAHHAARTTHYGSLPQKSQHGRPQDENPVSPLRPLPPLTGLGSRRGFTPWELRYVRCRRAAGRRAVWWAGRAPGCSCAPWADLGGERTEAKGRAVAWSRKQMGTQGGPEWPLETPVSSPEPG
uniref:Myelin basic protein n=1 Tax=Molossus molossus TaxID=27622 RepID=A0A7J8HHL7_MOLMO|nr:myelin basic protein [Molossus molossus]